MDKLTNVYNSILEAIRDLNSRREQGTITASQLQDLSVLNTCLYFVGKTLSVKQEDPPAKISRRFTFTEEETLKDFLFRLSVGKGEISLRRLTRALLNISKHNHQITSSQIAENIGISHQAISGYVNEKSSISSKTLEKIINYIQTNA